MSNSMRNIYGMPNSHKLNKLESSSINKRALQLIRELSN